MSPAEVTVESGEMKLAAPHEGVIDLPILSGLRPWCNFSGKSSKIENVGMHFTLLIASCRKGPNQLFDAI
jgi:hypothetical protein